MTYSEIEEGQIVIYSSTKLLPLGFSAELMLVSKKYKLNEHKLWDSIVLVNVFMREDAQTSNDYSRDCELFKHGLRWTLGALEKPIHLLELPTREFWTMRALQGKLVPSFYILEDEPHTYR